MLVVLVPPLTMLVTLIVLVVPFGNTMVAVTALAVLGPLLTMLTTAVMVWPGVALAGTLIVMARSATGVSAVAAVAVLLPGLVSAVVLVTAPLKVCTVVLPAGTL